MNYTCILFGTVFIIIGLIFAFGRGHIHLAAWKNMSQEEKDKIKIQPLCRNIGEVIILDGIIFLVKGVWTNFSNHWFISTMIAWMIVAGIDVWYISKSRRYQNE